MTALTEAGRSPRRPPWVWLGFGFVTWIAAYASQPAGYVGAVIHG
ncbi:hypothetical protein [Sulfuritalea sp.]|nr:hypothetical protein [Sulfuritalea sp.]